MLIIAAIKSYLVKGHDVTSEFTKLDAPISFEILHMLKQKLKKISLGQVQSHHRRDPHPSHQEAFNFDAEYSTAKGSNKILAIAWRAARTRI